MLSLFSTSNRHRFKKFEKKNEMVVCVWLVNDNVLNEEWTWFDANSIAISIRSH